MSKLRTPTKADMEKAEQWLAAAQYNLKRNEYHRVKLLCKQVIRALRRKDTETPNVQAQGRCAALSRSVPWSAVLGDLSPLICTSHNCGIGW